MTIVSTPDVARHKCMIYDGEPAEQLPVVVPLLMDGLRDHWRCLYLGDPGMLEMVATALGDRGIDTHQAIAEGSLILSSDRSHLRGGRFDPRTMVDELRSMIDESVRDGYSGLCATGDMRWELGSDQNFEHLLEYEALLEQVFRDKPLRGICQYHRRTVPPAAIRDALLTHRTAYVGDVLNRDNLFYIPPELLLGAGEADRARHGEWMCQQIVRVLDAEEKRDAALSALAQANRELEERVADRTAALEAANQQLESFSYSVSHDLRAPLRHISGFTAMLAEEANAVLGDQGRRYLDRIQSGVRNMQELIDGMLVLSRVVKVAIKTEGLDLSAMAREIARQLGEQHQGRVVEVHIEPGLYVLGDRALLRAALTNLLGNAWKFTGKRPSARIDLGRQGEERPGWPVFFVRDNGAGFDMRYAERLFGVFQRLHHEQDFPGTGVGLATVQRIITRHGGRVRAVSEPDRGATFFFTLPEAVLGA